MKERRIASMLQLCAVSHVDARMNARNARIYAGGVVLVAKKMEKKCWGYEIFI